MTLTIRPLPFIFILLAIVAWLYKPQVASIPSFIASFSRKAHIQERARQHYGENLTRKAWEDRRVEQQYEFDDCASDPESAV